jgi:tRNA pseudouridine65 synthase
MKPVLPILYQDESLVAIDKPWGIHVHPPEDSRVRITAHQNGLAILRDQIGQYLYPVHRLDPATTGVLIYALTKDAASKIHRSLSERRVQKTYWAVVRGFTPEEGVIERPLKRDSSDTMAPALTRYRRLLQVEIPEPVRPHPSARYSWLEVKPHTGVYHQIRRHMTGISHPLVGDSQHGDGEHNRFFRDRLGIPGLLLRATQIVFEHPVTSEPLTIDVGESPLWARVRAEIGWG